MFDLSTGQQVAANSIKEWFEEQERLLYHEGDDCSPMEQPIFRVFGYAGTGKTTTIRHIMDQLGIRSETLFAAYTGKAAMVMRKTGLPARTIHSLIYEPVAPDSNECEKLSKAYKLETDPTLKAQLKQELREKSKVHFILRDRENSGLKQARLLVLDECSMVNDEMLADLLSFNVPMLVLGDPGQLPPIDGEGALTRTTPDVMLTEIHRQAKGNPIIDFATRARNGIYIPRIAMGTSSHCLQASLSSEQVLKFDQIITGKNFTRHR